MPERILTSSNDLMIVIFAIIAAFWGGLVSYFSRINAGLKHSKTQFAIHIATSGFAGLLAYLGCLAVDTPAPITGMVCGIAGHMGAEAIRLFENRFKDRMK